MFQESTDTVGLNGPDEPHHKEYGRHGGRHVQVGIATAQQRPTDVKISRCVVITPTNSSDSWNQAKPVHEENKNENGRKEPKSLGHQVATDDVLQKAVQTFDQPLPKILNSARDALNAPGCDL